MGVPVPVPCRTHGHGLWPVTRRGQVLVAGVSLFVVYNLNLRAIESRDTRAIEHVALSIAARVDADLNEFPALYPAEHLADPSGATIRVDGHVRATYPVVTSLAAVPFFWGAIRFGLLDPERPHSIQIEAVGKLAASVWTSLACIALGLLIGKMAAPAPAVPFMLAAGFATPLWSSASQAFWSHAPAACFLALALMWIIDRPLTSSRAVIAGVAFGLAVACRPLLAVFPVGALVGLLLVERDHRHSLWLVAGCAVVLAALGIYHLASFGALLGGQASLESAWVHQQTHRVDGAWSGNPFVGLTGILISPSRGILTFVPIVWLVWPAARAVWTNSPFFRWALIVPSLLFVLIWSKYAGLVGRSLLRSALCGRSGGARRHDHRVWLGPPAVESNARRDRRCRDCARLVDRGTSDRRLLLSEWRLERIAGERGPRPRALVGLGRLADGPIVWRRVVPSSMAAVVCNQTPDGFKTRSGPPASEPVVDQAARRRK